MTSTDMNPLAKEYLRDLKRVSRCLPRDRRIELISEIESHLHESIAPGASDAEVEHILDRLGIPEQIVAADLPHEVRQAPAGNGREVSAIFLLLLGGILVWIGWFVGLFLLWTSKAWTVTDKLIGTVIIPGGLATSLFIALATGTGTGSCSGSGHGTHCTSSGGAGFGTMLLMIVLLLAPILTSVYLGYRAWAARRVYNITALAAAAA